MTRKLDNAIRAFNSHQTDFTASRLIQAAVNDWKEAEIVDVEVAGYLLLVANWLSRER